MEWVLLGTIVTIIIVGCWLARSTQDYIDEQNERYRKERDNDKLWILLLRWFLWFNYGIGGSSMSNKHFCQGPNCHEQVTTDRFLKSRGVIRGRYAYANMDRSPTNGVILL